LKVSFFLSGHRKFHMNWTSFKRSPVLKDPDHFFFWCQMWPLNTGLNIWQVCIPFAYFRLDSKVLCFYTSLKELFPFNVQTKESLFMQSSMNIKYIILIICTSFQWSPVLKDPDHFFFWCQMWPLNTGLNIWIFSQIIHLFADYHYYCRTNFQ
jgi:hypothetical protein